MNENSSGQVYFLNWGKLLFGSTGRILPVPSCILHLSRYGTFMPVKILLDLLKANTIVKRQF